MIGEGLGLLVLIGVDSGAFELRSPRYSEFWAHHSPRWLFHGRSYAILGIAGPPRTGINSRTDADPIAAAGCGG